MRMYVHSPFPWIEWLWTWLWTELHPHTGYITLLCPSNLFISALGEECATLRDRRLIGRNVSIGQALGRENPRLSMSDPRTLSLSLYASSSVPTCHPLELTPRMSFSTLLLLPSLSPGGVGFKTVPYDRTQSPGSSAVNK